jgi:hypothetical protein
MVSVILGVLTQQVMHIAIVKITCDTDVAAEYQHISTVCVADF